MSALPQSPAPLAPPTSHALPVLRLSRNEAQARTTIAQRAAQLPLSLGATTWSAQLIPVVHASALPEPGYLIRMEWAGAAFALRLPGSAVEQLIGASVNGASLPTLPPALAQATVEAAMRSLLQSLQQLGRGSPALVRCADGDTDTEPLPQHAFNLQLHAAQGNESIAGSLHADGLGLLLVAGLLHTRPPVALRPLHQVPLTLHADIGFTRLPADELSQLCAGDVVLMDSCFIHANRILWLSADGRAGLHAQLSPTQDAAPPHLTIIQPWTIHMPTDTDSVTAQATESSSDAATATLASLPVRLSFDLGDVQLTLAQVQSLQAGQTLDLGHPLAGAVRIRANGALIGEGDLVEIDGQLGVSIARIFAQAR